MSHQDREERHGRGTNDQRRREREDDRPKRDEARGGGREGRESREARENRPARGPQRSAPREERREAGRSEERRERDDKKDDGPNGFPEKRLIDMVVRLVTERVMEAMRKELDARGLTVPPTVDVTPKVPETKGNTGDSEQQPESPKPE